MGKRNLPKKDIQLVMRIDQELNNNLEKLAIEEDLPLSTVARRILKEAFKAKKSAPDK